MAGASGMISVHDFLNDNALSFRKQRYLKDLFAAVRDERKPLTIVVGAGVSISSGLPSWPQLIKNMIDDLGVYREALREDGLDPMRKAEVVLHLAKMRNKNALESELIRDALYQRNLEAIPGQLVASVARLTVARPKVRLLTTNFDSLLESALCQYVSEEKVRIFTLKDVEDWEEWDGIGVLHLHGAVLQRDDSAGTEETDRSKHPVILTESQFLRHGAKVRETIAQNLRQSHSLFVGLSISDPNLVGPLYATRDLPGSRCSRFMLTVPRLVKGSADAVEATKYAFASADYFDRQLDLKPVFLKSYSQLNQVVSDLTLSVLEPQSYFQHHKSTSLEYGWRLIRTLDECYRNIGCPGKEKNPRRDEAEILSRRLQEVLVGGPAKLLKQLAREYGVSQLCQKDGENFSLFLWLRSRSPRRGAVAPYTLNLVGTSAYAHREEWFFARRVAAIRADSPMAVAQAVFHGNHQVDAQPDPPWRGVLAAPIVIAPPGGACMAEGTPADVLTVGSIALHSTSSIAGFGNGDSDWPGAAVSDGDHISLVSKLSSEHANDLLKKLVEAAEKVLMPG